MTPSPRARLASLLLILTSLFIACGGSESSGASESCGSSACLDGVCVEGACLAGCERGDDCGMDELCVEAQVSGKPGVCVPADSLGDCDEASDCDALLNDACAEALCDLKRARCTTRPMANGSACAAADDLHEHLCYAGDCLQACELSGDCTDDAGDAEALCVNRQLGLQEIVGICISQEELSCSDDDACMEVQTAPCMTPLCDGSPAEPGVCAVTTVTAGTPCGDIGACFEGLCHRGCDPEDVDGEKNGCPEGTSCVEASEGLSLCLEDTVIDCDQDQDCAPLAPGACRAAHCYEGHCVTHDQVNGLACDQGRICWGGRCLGSEACDEEGTCPLSERCVTASAGDPKPDDPENAGAEICVPATELTCEQDDDCLALLLEPCEEARCGAVPGQGPEQAKLCAFVEAVDGTSCRDDRVCIAGVCSQPCEDSSSCPEGWFCAPIAPENDAAEPPGDSEEMTGGCSPKTCTTQADCEGLWATTEPCEKIICNSLTNQCQRSPKPEGASCDDGDLCNGIQRCNDGACAQSAKPVTCATPEGQTCTTIECDPASGACIAISAPDGGACEDGARCTIDSTCQAGMCIAGSLTCQACVYDHECEEQDDDDRCNGITLCMDGVCTWNPETIVSCPPSEEPCQTAVCEPATGACLLTPVPDDLPCQVGSDLCAATYSCQAGACELLVDAVSCEALPEDCVENACDPTSGDCVTLALDTASLFSSTFDAGTELTDFSIAENNSTDGRIGATVTTAKAMSEPGALFLGDPTLGSYDNGGLPFVLRLESATFPLHDPTATRISFALNVDLDVAAGDTLRLLLEDPLSGAAQVLVSVNGVAPWSFGDDWRLIEHSCTLPATESARLVVLFTGNGVGGDHAGVFLDDVNVTRTCL